MIIHCTFKNVKNAEILQEYVSTRLQEVVSKYIQHPRVAELTFIVSGFENRVHCRVSCDEKYRISAEGIGVSMSAAIEIMINRISYQAAKQKDKNLDKRKKRVRLGDLSVLTDPQFSEDSIDAEQVLAEETWRRKIRKAG